MLPFSKEAGGARAQYGVGVVIAGNIFQVMEDQVTQAPEAARDRERTSPGLWLH